MCFSATASFTASGILTPLGVYALGRCYHADRRYLALAAFPLLFGIQQAVEGWGWLAIEGGVQSDIHRAALGFLFFAYFLWPLLVPLSTCFVEESRERRVLFLSISLVGGLFGLSLYSPLFLNADWLSVQIANGSILYQSTLIYDGVIPRTGVRLIYAAIVGLPLLFSTIPSIRIFGVLILLSVISGFLFFAYAFTSIWCFIAAILSICILHIVRCIPKNRKQ